MPTVPAERLMEIERVLLGAAGASAEEAEIVARHSIAANLAGHDSHGIIRIPVYIDRIRRGHIVPGAPIEIVTETDASTVIDGHWGFGYVVSERAMDITIEKARRRGVAAASTRSSAKELARGPKPQFRAPGQAHYSIPSAG